MSGEAVADTAGIGSILIPAMEKEGYDKDFAAAVTVSSAVIGPIIPPSVSMIICAALASVSVGRMFLGGMIPGILFGLLLMGLSKDPTTIMVIIVLGLFVLGCFLSTTPALMLVVPVLLPVVTEAGYDLIHFFVVVTLALLLGTLTPPVGINLYLVCSISGVPTSRLLKELLPFYLVLIGVIFLAVFVPWIVTAPGSIVYGNL